ncbi:hypothetical protein B0H16DRAFT_1758468 [Mycena metata]|uniref:Uncharacterized protein n=1 Tax=Mycena metata TaxID=1033252 RepID=A0AAD7MZZ5_9AGAR|nr:hypothetical protein B0H16DRAFT_1758468 [Mycena metata]
MSAFCPRSMRVGTEPTHDVGRARGDGYLEVGAENQWNAQCRGIDIKSVAERVGFAHPIQMPGTARVYPPRILMGGRARACAETGAVLEIGWRGVKAAKWEPGGRNMVHAVARSVSARVQYGRFNASPLRDASRVYFEKHPTWMRITTIEEKLPWELRDHESFIEGVEWKDDFNTALVEIHCDCCYYWRRVESFSKGRRRVSIEKEKPGGRTRAAERHKRRPTRCQRHVDELVVKTGCL